MNMQERDKKLRECKRPMTDIDVQIQESKPKIWKFLWLDHFISL